MENTQFLFVEAIHEYTKEKVVFTDLDNLAIIGQFTINRYNNTSDNIEESQHMSEAIKHVLSIKGLNPKDYIVS